MSSIIPIKLPIAEIHIKADRRLVFQLITAWGVSGKDGIPKNRILKEEGDTRLIEFRTEIKGFFGKKKIYTTQEWVRAVEPEHISFRGFKGPLPLLRDDFFLIDQNGCTNMQYESTIGLKYWIIGWLVGHLYVSPVMQRFMRSHLQELKATSEARAERSVAFPLGACGHSK